MQTGLVSSVSDAGAGARPARARPWSARRALATGWHWLVAYELGSDDKIRRVTGGR